MDDSDENTHPLDTAESPETSEIWMVAFQNDRHRHVIRHLGSCNRSKNSIIFIKTILTSLLSYKVRN